MIFQVTFIDNINDCTVNGHKIDKTVIIDSLNHETISELMKNNSWYGERLRYNYKNIIDVISVKYQNISHIIKSFSIENDSLIGNIEILDNKQGRMLKKFILKNKAKFKLRAILNYMESRLHIISFDWMLK